MHGDVDVLFLDAGDGSPHDQVLVVAGDVERQRADLNVPFEGQQLALDLLHHPAHFTEWIEKVISH